MALYEGTSGNDFMAGSDNDGDESEAFGAMAGNDTITGLNGDDVIDGGPGTDVAVFRGPRSDYRFSLVVDDDMVGFLVFGVTDTVTGRDGTDVLINVEFTEFADGRFPWYDLPINMSVHSSFGPADTVELFGGKSNDTMTGHDGPDRFIGGLGNDVIVGGVSGASDSNDTVIYVASSSGWVRMDPIVGGIKANLQTGIVTGAWGNDTLGGIENIVGTPYGDELTGSVANNILSGGAGNDTLIGSAGNDRLQGGEGFDTAIYAGPISGYAVGMTDVRTVSDVEGAGGIDNLSGIERVLFDDMGIAFDLDGNAGDAARLIGVLFDAEYLDDPYVVRSVLEAFDAGYSAEEIAEYAIDLVYPGYTPTQFSTLVFYNLAGFMPDEADIAFLNGLIDEHSMAWLTVIAADTTYNDENIGFSGLVANGLEFAAF